MLFAIGFMACSGEGESKHEKPVAKPEIKKAPLGKNVFLETEGDPAASSCRPTSACVKDSSSSSLPASEPRA